MSQTELAIVLAVAGAVFSGVLLIGVAKIQGTFRRPKLFVSFITETQLAKKARNPVLAMITGVGNLNGVDVYGWSLPILIRNDSSLPIRDVLITLEYSADIGYPLNPDFGETHETPHTIKRSARITDNKLISELSLPLLPPGKGTYAYEPINFRPILFKQKKDDIENCVSDKDINVVIRNIHFDVCAESIAPMEFNSMVCFVVSLTTDSIENLMRVMVPKIHGYLIPDFFHDFVDRLKKKGPKFYANPLQNFFEWDIDRIYATWQPDWNKSVKMAKGFVVTNHYTGNYTQLKGPGERPVKSVLAGDERYTRGRDLYPVRELREIEKIVPFYLRIPVIVYKRTVRFFST